MTFSKGMFLGLAVSVVVFSGCGEASNRSDWTTKPSRSPPSYERTPVKPSYGRFYVGCETGHWIKQVSGDGAFVILEDDSVWEINVLDQITTLLWMPFTEVLACDDKIINIEDGEVAIAMQIR
jgi:hypothetical protein